MTQTSDWSTLDASALADRLQNIPGWPWKSRAITLTEISGGLNNGNWRLVVDDGTSHFVKVPGAGTEAFVDRELTVAASRCAASVGVGPQCTFYDSASGITVDEYLDGYVSLTEHELATTDAVVDVVKMYRTLHRAPLLPKTRTVIDEIDQALDSLRERGFEIPGWMSEPFAEWNRAASALRASGIDLAPCHNDPNFTNMMVKPGAPMRLVDYEFAANNDPAYDVLGMLGFYPVPERTKIALIEEYFGRYEYRYEARMRVMTLAILMRFGLWALSQALERDADYDYARYGLVYFVNAKALYRDPRWDSWLHAL